MLLLCTTDRLRTLMCDRRPTTDLGQGGYKADKQGVTCVSPGTGSSFRSSLEWSMTHPECAELASQIFEGGGGEEEEEAVRAEKKKSLLVSAIYQVVTDVNFVKACQVFLDCRLDLDPMVPISSSLCD